MDFLWNEKTLAWFEAASAYTGFHSRLADVVRPYIEGCETLCDIGCGLGLLDLALAGDVRRAVCIDQSETAIAALNEIIRARGARNVVARTADANGLTEECGDAVILSFFGSSGADIERFLPLCRKRLILIVHEKSSPTRCANAVALRPRPLGAAEVTDYLTNRRLKFRKTVAELEFGQPFRSLEDARDFIRIYAAAAPDADDADAGGQSDWDRLYGDMERRLVRTGLSDYPLYLPKPKRLAVFAAEKEARPR
jgi:SAM-dependent methyltransferase